MTEIILHEDLKVNGANRVEGQTIEVSEAMAKNLCNPNDRRGALASHKEEPDTENEEHKESADKLEVPELDPLPDEMTKAELKELAEDLGLDLKSNALKAEYLEAVKEELAD